MSAVARKLGTIGAEYGLNVLALSDRNLAIIESALRGFEADCLTAAEKDASMRAAWLETAGRAGSLGRMIGEVAEDCAVIA